MQMGMNQTWWKVVDNLFFEVYGQMIYLATPIMNFLLNKYPIRSTYLLIRLEWLPQKLIETDHKQARPDDLYFLRENADSDQEDTLIACPYGLVDGRGTILLVARSNHEDKVYHKEVTQRDCEGLHFCTAGAADHKMLSYEGSDYKK